MPKVPMLRAMPNSAAENSAGLMMGIVMRRMMKLLLAPRISADSSNCESMLVSAPCIKR
ncbi:MAG: hypothetical protein BWY85_01567 [Firmicutes bacterium ADurb.Bin506]|nr:MAG: hypothetical protein BWY85_01567 [Firmicutes bacterium ADurb.Bin506]